MVLYYMYYNVVLGGGNSAGYVADEYVKGKGVLRQLCMVTDEAVVAYERPALSKSYLAPDGDTKLAAFLTCAGSGGKPHNTDWYKEPCIEYKLNTKIVKADLKDRLLVTEDGMNIKFMHLVIATGCRPVNLSTDLKLPGAHLRGIEYLRSLNDADILIDSIRFCKAEGNKAVVVGGGFLGLECAAALNAHGLDVTLITPDSRLLQRLFTPEIAEFYEREFASKGVRVIKGARAASFEGNEGTGNKVSHTVLDSGDKVEGSLVVAAVGAKPNLELFGDQLEMAAGGIKVDGQLRSSIEYVFAVGDVAAFPLQSYDGKVVRQEHVHHARRSAVHVTNRLLQACGDPPAEPIPDYDYIPSYYSKLWNLSWKLFGVIDAAEPVFFGDTAERKFGTYWVKDGQVVATFMEGGTLEEGAALEKVAAAKPPAPDKGADFLAFAFALKVSVEPSPSTKAKSKPAEKAASVAEDGAGKPAGALGQPGDGAEDPEVAAPGAALPMAPLAAAPTDMSEQ